MAVHALLPFALILLPLAPTQRRPVPVPASEPPATHAPEELATIRGRFVQSDGAPAAGAAVSLRGGVANGERVARHGLPKDWRDLEATAARDGSFELRFAPPAAFQFALEGYLPGHAPAQWRWGEIEPGRVLDLGDVALRPGGSIDVRVVRPDGSPAQADWRVHAESREGAEWEGRDATRRSGVLDAEQGAWRITDMPPGPATVKAYSEIGGWVEGEPIEVRAGETVACAIVHEGPDLARRIVVTTFSRPIWRNPAPEKVWLEQPGSAARIPCAATFGSQSFDFPDLELGVYKLVIDDPAFERFERDGVRPGDYVPAHLTGSAAVRLEVVDADTGAPIRDWSLAIRKETKGLGHTTHHAELVPVVPKGSAPPADGRIGSLVPWDYTLLCEAPSYAEESIAVPALAAGEERALRVALSHGKTVSGIVVTAAGAPAAGATVELYRPGVLQGSPVHWWGGRSLAHLERFRLDSRPADAEGRFRFPRSPEGPLVLRALSGAGVHAVLEVGAGPGREHHLVLPPVVFLSGRVLAPLDASTAGLTVRAGIDAPRLAAPPSAWIRGFQEFLDAPVAADGAFRLGPLPTGALRFAVLPPGEHDGGNLMYRAVLDDRMLDLAAGEHRVDVDLRSTWPGEIEVVVRAGDRALPQRMVVLRREGQDPWTAALPTDPDGEVVFLAPAGEYRMQVFGGVWEHEVKVTIESGARERVVLETPAVHGELVILAAESGAPVPHARVVVLRDQAGRRSWMVVESDERGVVELALTPGIAWLGRMPEGLPAPRSTDRMTAVEWTAVGPGQDRVLVDLLGLE